MYARENSLTTIRGRGMSCFLRPGRHCLYRSPGIVTCLADRMPGNRYFQGRAVLKADLSMDENINDLVRGGGGNITSHDPTTRVRYSSIPYLSTDRGSRGLVRLCLETIHRGSSLLVELRWRWGYVGSPVWHILSFRGRLEWSYLINIFDGKWDDIP